MVLGPTCLLRDQNASETPLKKIDKSAMEPLNEATSLIKVTESKFLHTEAARYGTKTHDVDEEVVSFTQPESDEESSIAGDENLYSAIPSFDDYTNLCNDSHYIRLPSHWTVVVTDIMGSTTFIERGRYRDVNTVGAMCICAVRNVIGEVDFPYVFGGDGASMVLRPDQRDTAVTALLNLKRMVKQNYAMELRVGTVPIQELDEQGASVHVARYEVASGMTIALFRGGGLALADSMVKMGNELRHTRNIRPVPPNLEGLSCRWRRIPNANGCVLTLLVMCNPTCENESQVYQNVLLQLETILTPATVKTSNPVNVKHLQYKTASEMVKDEARMHEAYVTGAWILRLLEILLCHVIFYWGLFQQLVIDVAAYKEGMRTHTDHRKFDDMIRMVLDCSQEQADQIEDHLKFMYRNRRQIFYGTQRSENTLVTCLLEGTNDGEHIHFVDGDAGGYAMAAKQLKLQLGSWTMSKRSSLSTRHLTV